MSDLGSGDEGSNSQKYHGQVGMESGNADFDSGQQGHAEQELATKMLQIQSKRFYLDVKQNRRGRFIKVAEIGADGRRSQIFLALSTAAEFRDHLSTFSDFYASLGPPNPDNVPEDGKLKSEMMIKDNRRYYLDLKENSRGRFLRVSSKSLVSQTITRGGPRSQVAIPAQGMIEFRDALTDLLDEFSTDEHGYKPELPEGRHMHVDNKNFYFDIGQNNRGIYMRISEVKTNFRTAITVPEKSWCRFRDILADYCEKIKQADQIQPPMSFFGFGQTADIDIRLDGADTRKTAEIKTEDGKKERLLLYYDGETVSGQVNISLRKAGSKLEHQGIKIEFIGQIELFYDRGNHHEFTSLVKELARPGEMIANTSYRFEFACVEKPFEVYTGSNVRLRYFLRVTIVRRLADLVKELDIAVHTLSSYPEMNNSIKMEVGIEDCLHIEFEYNKSKYHLKDVIVGKIYFLLVRIKIKHMEIAIIKRETTGMGNNIFNENETIAKYEIMDGAPVRGESIPIRVFLAGYDLTPTMRDINKKFSVRYFLNLVLMDTEDRRYFKQQEITLWRKGEKHRKPHLQSPHLPSHLVNINGNLIESSNSTSPPLPNDITPPNGGSASEPEANDNQSAGDAPTTDHSTPPRNIEHMKREEADGQTASSENQH